MPSGLLRLLRELGDAVVGVDAHDAERRRLLARHFDDADGDVGALLDVRGEHRAVVHLVDVIAGQHQHVPRMVQADDLQVLVQRVGGAAIPEVAHLLLRRDHLDELVELAAQVAPAALDVLDQRVRLVLRHDGDPADARVDAVRQHEVDDAELAAERRRRLAAMVGQVFQALAAAARHDDRERVARDAADVAADRSLPQERRCGSSRRPCRCWSFLHVRSSRIPCSRIDPDRHGSRPRGGGPPSALAGPLA